MRGKRVLSLILALVMALSLCGNVWALTDGESAAVDTWIETYIDYNAEDQELCGLKDIMIDYGNFTSESDYNKAKAAVTAYDAFSDEQRGEIKKRLPVTNDYKVAVMMEECRGLTTLPYYDLLSGVTNQAVTSYIKKYIYWNTWADSSGKWYSTGIKDAYDYHNQYQPAVVKAALDAYKALSPADKAVLDALTVRDGEAEGSCEKTFAFLMQLKEQEYRGNTNKNVRTLTDISGLSNADARAFIDTYFKTDGNTYYDNGIKCLDIWASGMNTAPTGGHKTQASYDRAVALLAAYNALSDAAKDDLDRLCVSAYDTFGTRVIYDFSNPQMAAATGTASVTDLGDDAENFLTSAGISIDANGALTVDGATLEKKNEKWYAKIDFTKTNTTEGLASMTALEKALTAYYGTDFDNSVSFEPLWNRNNAVLNELNMLSLSVYGEAMWFEEAMSWLGDVYNNTKYGGYYEEYFFRAAGYAVPEEGKDFTVRVPEGLEKGVDYDYTYTTNSDDPAENGVLTIYVKAGVKEHWKQAVESTEKVARNAGVLFSVDFKRPTNAYRFASICGQGIDGMFAKYLDFSNKAKQELYDSGRNIDGGAVGNGRIMASINQVGNTLTVTSNDTYAIDHMPIVWYESAKGESGSDDLTEVSRLMLAFRVVVVDEFSYEFDVSSRTATVKSVAPDDGWEQVETLSSDLIVRPKSGKINALKPDSSYKDKYENEDPSSGRWSLGTFTLTPPETGYTLDIDASNELTQDGYLWVDKSAANTLRLYTWDNSTQTTFYTFVWKKNGAPDIKEELTVRVTEAQSVFADIGEGSTKAEPEKKTVVDNAVQGTPIDGMETLYDATLGFMETMFKDLPSVADAKKLLNGAGVTMQPPEGATHFRWTMGDGNNDLAYISQSEADEFETGLRDAASETFALYDGEELTRDAADKLTFPYAYVNVLEVEGLSIYYVTTQNYRFEIVEWLKEVPDTDGDGSHFETVGYTYMYGRSGPMVKSVVTQSVSDIDDVPENGKNKPYYVCDEEVNFTCNQYVQEGAANCWYFRLTVDDQGKVEHEEGWVYLPYCYFGDLTYEQARQRANPPRILHYEKGERMTPTEITGEYTEYGVRFAVNSFSPFVVELDDTLKTDDDNGGNNSAATDNNGSGHEPVRRYPAAGSTNGAADNAQQADSGNTVQSADTGDAGIVLYAALCVSSLLGMGYAGGKRR